MHDEEKYGRTLSDDEYNRAIKDRDDIFFIVNDNLLLKIEAVVLLIGMLVGIWLSTMQATKVLYHDTMPTVRTSCKLLINSKLKSGTNTLTEEPRIEETINELPFRPAYLFTKHLAVQASRQNPLSTTKINISNLKKSIVASQSAQLISPSISVISPNATNNNLVSQDNNIQTEKETDLIKIGEANKKQGDRAKAFTAFRQVLTQNPHNMRALTGMGDLFLYSGLLDSSVTFYAAAIAENPNAATAHTGLGTAKYYLSVMGANPHFADARNIKDQARYIQAQYDSAIAEYTNAIRLDSSSVDAMTNRGVILDLHGNQRAAIADYTLAIKTKPTYAEAYSKRAATYKSLGKFKEALTDYTAAIKLDSSSYEFDPSLHFANAYFGRGNVLYQLKEFEKAIADYDSTLALSPNHSLAILNKARSLVDVNRFDSAIVWYTKAISIISPMEYDGALERALVGRGMTYNIISQSAPALKDFDEALKLKPDDYYAHFHRGNSYKALDKYDEAIADYTSALESSRLAAKACWRIAECYAIKNDKAQALSWLKKSVQNGYTDFAAWKRDKSLEGLWGDEEFERMTK